jgi:prepilin-type N-terminal cleavage/methylation domain-containing protein
VHARGCEERGWTLVELLITVLILGVVMAAVLTLFNATVGQAARDQEWAHTVSATQAGLNRMTRELRQAQTGTITISNGSAASAGNTIVAQVRLGNGAGTATWVRYDCTATSSFSSSLSKCTRQTSTAATVSSWTGITAVPAIDPVRITSTSCTTATSPPCIFAGTGPNYSVTIRVPSSGTRKAFAGHGHDFTFSDGIYGRNL